MLYAVIIAGGSGTRFWPQSRKKSPKQLLTIVGRRTMIEDTAGRFSGFIPASRIHVITNVAQASYTRKVLKKIPRRNIIAEPVGRDTAAAIGLGAVIISKNDPDALMVVLPADHIIRPRENFVNSIKAAAQIAKDEECLITFGIPPAGPSTGYGYIHGGRKLATVRGLDAYSVKEFKEKPDRKTAERFVASGRYYWNSGIFLWRASVILKNIKKYLPGHFRALMKVKSALGTAAEKKVIERQYKNLKKISIDYAVLEKARDVRVLAVDYDWDDVGAWPSLENHLIQDKKGNTVIANFVGLNAKRSLIVGGKKHLLAAIDTEDLVIVHTPDATLVCPKKSAQKVKDLVNLLKEKGMDGYL